MVAMRGHPPPFPVACVFPVYRDIVLDDEEDDDEQSMAQGMGGGGAATTGHVDRHTLPELPPPFSAPLSSDPVTCTPTVYHDLNITDIVGVVRMSLFALCCLRIVNITLDGRPNGTDIFQVNGQLVSVIFGLDMLVTTWRSSVKC